jgi:hypothetical protein
MISEAAFQPLLGAAEPSLWISNEGAVPLHCIPKAAIMVLQTALISLCQKIGVKFRKITFGA